MNERQVELTGEQLLAARKILKAAAPKKRLQDKAVAAIRVTTDLVEFVIPGAAARSLANTTGTFVVEMPWREFHVVMTEPCAPTDVIHMRFAKGVFDYNGVASRSEAIHVRDRPGPMQGTWASLPAIGKRSDDPTDDAIGHPLLSAYRYTKQYGIRPTLGDKNLLLRQMEVEKLLNMVAKKLQPLGLTRSDLESLLDRKLAT